MIQITQKDQCTGCGACQNICPAECIQLKPDEEGFLYPQALKEQCVNCGMCEKVCPVLLPYKDIHFCDAYAARIKDTNIRRHSSSGGVFSALAQYILENNGVVFGAAFDTDFSVKHICVDSIEQLKQLQGSKYVQSKIEDSFKSAKQHLEKGIPVLFSGTPCQIAGLQKCLGKTYPNLYLQDIICHGVPSPAVWQSYLKFVQKQAGAKLKDVSFRSKTVGWRTYQMRFEFENGQIFERPISDDIYMQGFLQNLTLRPSCYNCAFKTKTRCSDVTLADFWGVEYCNPVMDDDNGISLVILHSEKGRELFEHIQDKLETEKTDIEKTISYNLSMVHSARRNPKRDAFVRCVLQKGIQIAYRKHLKTKFVMKLLKMIKAIMLEVRSKNNGTVYK